MPEERHKLTAEELRAMLQANGLQLTAEQFEFTLKNQPAFEALVNRVRKGVRPTDEPGFAFNVPRSMRKPS